MSFISLDKVYKRYRTGGVVIEAAKGMSFDIERGELAVIVGPSGSGKTTILNILGGMDNSDEGKVEVNGVQIQNYTRKQLIEYRRHKVGFILQFYNLIPNLTARENVELAAQITPDFIPAEEILAQVGLEDRMDNFPAQLSGGEQQRVSIARALAKKPALLLCDEPTGALDYDTGKQILIQLEALAREQGKTVVIVTHTQEIGKMADRVVRMRDGRIIAETENRQPIPAESIEW